MRLFEIIQVFLITILIACIVIIIPCEAASSDIRISQQVPDTISGRISTDGTFIIFQSDSLGPEIYVYSSDGILFEKIPLSTDTSELESLELSEGTIYYSEYDISEPWYSRNQTVYTYTLSTKERQKVFTIPFVPNVQQKITRIVADGGNIVFQNEGGGNSLVLQTLPTKTPKVIFNSHDWIYDLAIDGDRIVWGCERTDKEPGREIHVYTIPTGTDYIIPESKSDRTYGTVDISGNKVTWTMALHAPYLEEDGDYHGMRGSDIRITDLDTHITQSVEKNEGYSKSFISGNYIVYLKRPANDSNEIVPATIRCYNILTETASDLKNNVLNIDDFKGDLLIWSGEPRLSFFATSLSGNVPVATSSVSAPGISENRETMPQNSPNPASPINPMIIASSLTIGIAGYFIFNKRR
ncbi:MAG: hypothetical protein M0Q92_12760 [Methanoregula sp.]|jgi:hypothetical protein|nr:hypothetical protein [Methanoregula sp.]